MGNPSSGCTPVQPPMPLAKGSSLHHQSLSISSLPLDKLRRINCEKRTSVSALSSPASEKLSIATFLGHGHDFTRRKETSGAEELYLKGIDLATDDRKTISFNPFRGHRRVGSGSFTTPCKSASEYSPRARSGSRASSPSRKLDKYAVAKIAASLFHSPTKLERSMSLSRVAHRSAPEVAQTEGHRPSLAVGEVILPANLELSPFLPELSQFPQSGEGKRSSSSDSDLAMDTEECASPETSMQQNIIDISSMLEAEHAGEAEEVEPPVEDPPPTTEDNIASALSFPHSQEPLHAAENCIVHEEDLLPFPEDGSSSPSGSQSLCMASTEPASTESPPPLESQETGHESPEYNSALFEEESTDIAVDDNLQLMTISSEEVPDLTETAVQCSLSNEEDDDPSTDSEDDSPPPTGSSQDMNIQVPEMKTIRKRRRSVSASGIGAMLLKVVRVSDSAQMVTRRIPKAGSPELILSGVEALRARKYVLEKTAQISMGPSHDSDSATLISSARSTPLHTESEDAIKSTYSKFVDIEIDPGGHCIELVQHGKDGQDGSAFGAASTCESHQQATPGTSNPRHRDIQSEEHSTFTDVRASADPTSRARITSSDIHSLKECLTTAKGNIRERSRTVVLSRLQAPTPGAFSRVDVYRPCSTVSILANPSFSSSHQDKLWEEQAEIYSSGGRGTPGREDHDAAAAGNAIINLRSSPVLAFACPAHEVVSPNSVRRGGGGVVEPAGAKRGRPHTPARGRASPDSSGHFIHHLMSKIRGSNVAPKAGSGLAKSQLALEKRRSSTWSSCICFSVK